MRNNSLHIIKYLFILLAFLICNVSFAEEQPRFIEKAFWIVPKPTDGVLSKVYTTIYNPYDDVFIGVVELFDDTVIIQSKTFSVPARDITLVDFNWTPTAGNHSLSLRLNKTALQSNKINRKITLSDTSSSTENIFISKRIEKNNITKNSVANTTKSSILDKSRSREIEIVDLAKEKIKKALDPITSSSISRAWDSISSFREKKYENIEAERIHTKDLLSDKNDTKINTPFVLVKLFFLTLGAIFFSKTSIFVMFCLLLVVLLGRILWILYRKYRQYKHD